MTVDSVEFEKSVKLTVRAIFNQSQTNCDHLWEGIRVNEIVYRSLHKKEDEKPNSCDTFESKVKPEVILAKPTEFKQQFVDDGVKKDEDSIHYFSDDISFEIGCSRVSDDLKNLTDCKNIKICESRVWQNDFSKEVFMNKNDSPEVNFQENADKALLGGLEIDYGFPKFGEKFEEFDLEVEVPFFVDNEVLYFLFFSW